MPRRHTVGAIGSGVEIRDLDDDRSLTMTVEDAARVMTDLPTAILAASPSDVTRAYLRTILGHTLEALEGVGHA